MKKHHLIAIGIIFTLAFSSCSPTYNITVSSAEEAEALIDSLDGNAKVTVSAADVAGNTKPTPTATRTTAPIPTQEQATATPPPPAYPDCAEVRSGDHVTCVVERAYCSYLTTVTGSPTFCNDAKYPNHQFTFVAWEQDLSQWDGACMLVTGLVTVYDGKLQIEGSSAALAKCE